ncbi:MAG: DUF4055 domain-containing protein [Halomonas sp.]|nr:DUF4055 domain-containing protein [Halomonas sp.]
MSVETLHPLYTAHEQKASRVRDAVAGTDAVKARGKDYLPHPQEEYAALTGEAKAIADARYTAYKAAALWLGVTRRTHDGMLGAVYRKTPEIDLPGPIAYMEEDADGSGMSLVQFSRLAVSQTMMAGRHGVLVDYPEAEDGLTREQTRGLRATLRHYDSASIINWRREGELMTLVVLQESYEATTTDEFDRDLDVQYRVLTLEDGLYVQRVFRKGVEVARSEPRTAGGQRWSVIPFMWVGAVANDETLDNPLLLDIADLNFDHYRSSANRREASRIVGQPMIHIDIGETSVQDWNELNPTGIQVGSRRGVQTKGGTMAMVQAQPNDMSRQDMLDAEAQMLAIGARLLTNGGQNETAEAVRARSGAETANLSSVAHNVSDAIRKCLEWALEFMGGTGEPVFELSQEFYPQDAEPQMIMAMIQGVDRGLLADSDFFDWARKRGLIDPERTDEDVRADAQASGGMIGAI